MRLSSLVWKTTLEPSSEIIYSRAEAIIKDDDDGKGFPRAYIRVRQLGVEGQQDMSVQLLLAQPVISTAQASVAMSGQVSTADVDLSDLRFNIQINSGEAQAEGVIGIIDDALFEGSEVSRIKFIGESFAAGGRNYVVDNTPGVEVIIEDNETNTLSIELAKCIMRDSY